MWCAGFDSELVNSFEDLLQFVVRIKGGHKCLCGSFSHSSKVAVVFSVTLRANTFPTTLPRIVMFVESSLKPRKHLDSISAVPIARVNWKMLVWHCLVSCSDIGRRTIILIYDEDFDHTTSTDLSVHGKGIKCICKAISLNSTMFLCACPDSTSINYPGERLVYQGRSPQICTVYQGVTF